MIDLQKVCYAYEHEVALRYIDLHIEKGDSLVIQGPNGCGKSTLIKLLNGIIFPSEGSYFYKDHEISEKTQDMLTEFLQDFHKAGKTLITITHNRQLAEKLGKRFAVMNEDHELETL